MRKIQFKYFLIYFRKNKSNVICRFKSLIINNKRQTSDCGNIYETRSIYNLRAHDDTINVNDSSFSRFSSFAIPARSAFFFFLLRANQI